MKKLLVAAAIAVSMAFGLSAGAEARSSVGFYFGTPHYDYRVGDDYRYRDGYGWYRHGYDDRRYHRGRLSCGEARRAVRNQGYRNVSTVECRGTTYTFEATRGRRDREVTVFVNAGTGRVWRG